MVDWNKVMADSAKRQEELCAEMQAKWKEGLLTNMICPQCKEKFILGGWEDYGDHVTTLKIRGCPSGGLYDVRISCPFCDYEEEL
ncbi:MAG: hypothetical protein IH859_09390 [Chloroflexi bacterium]|nr:hypothetical protein [Chloroflexota bacterium]